MKLYEYAPTRSARCRWILKELDAPFESVKLEPAQIRSEEYKKVNPVGKVPCIEIDGKILIESVAITNYIADQFPEKGLIAKPGTWDRGEHDQFSIFALTEIEAYLWSTVRHGEVLKVYSEEIRVPQIAKANAQEARKGAEFFNRILENREYLIGNRFTACDINVSYALNWARLQNLLEGLHNINRYMETLFQREHCTLDKRTHLGTPN